MTATAKTEELEEEIGEFQEIDAAALSHIPVWRFLRPVSGLYESSISRLSSSVESSAITDDVEPEYEEVEAAAETDSAFSFPFWFRREQLRLDVDGRYPQLVASGTLLRGLTTRTHWIAKLRPAGANRWKGAIWYKDGDLTALPHTSVTIRAARGWWFSQRRARVTFSGGGAPKRTRTYRFRSPYFHPVEFEFDTVEGTQKATKVDTCAHPNRPATLTCEQLSIETVFRRAGFNVRKANDSPVPLLGAGANVRWSDMEMHDAMQTYWSRFANTAQWSMWVFFAALHEQGTSLGGIMFDDIGPNHRQGTAIFNKSFIANAPNGDSAPNAWTERMLFWTACHEMGHAFNLAHSWQKQLGTSWIPLPNENEARSFMNYPFRVAGGQTAFFSDFEYRFSDSELLFMRHAPARFVQMGNADWFDDHGFQQAEVLAEPTFKLELRMHREKRVLEFLEPAVLELKLTNISQQAQLVDREILSASDRMTVVLKKQGKAARQWAPFAQYCVEPDKLALSSGDSLYESLFIGSGRNGWDIAEPGRYTVQMILHSDGEDIVSNALNLRVSPPAGYDEEDLAQDFFSEDVGRILTFDGSEFLESGNDVLRRTVEELSSRKVALHAAIALGNTLANEYKSLDVGEDQRNMTAACAVGGCFRVRAAQSEEARAKLTAALTDDAERSAETLGHIDYKYYVDRFTDRLAAEGDPDAAAKYQNELYRTLSARNVKVDVLNDIQRRRDSYGGAAPGGPKSKTKTKTGAKTKSRS